MSFGIFAIGCLFLVAGVAYLAHLMQLPSGYVVASVVVLVGLVVATSAQRTSRGRI
jgi:hypothetical protein